MNHRTSWAATVALGLAATAFVFADEAATVIKALAIPSGPAERTLKLFTSQSGVELMYATDEVKGVSTNAVAGDLQPTDALEKMLAGTPLVVVRIEEPVAFSIRREKHEGQKGALAEVAPRVAAPVSTAASTETRNLPITLDPFKVSTERDLGYLANNTLSGTQFNTSLKDTAASISVITSEFMRDVGAFNIKDVMLYANNTVPDLDEGTAGGNPPNGNFMSGTYNQFRVRGSDISQSVDYFVTTNLPVDLYNIDRIEESRGPNSVLFGIGSPSGVLNYSTKQAVIGRTFGDASITAGSYNTVRGTLDYNKSFDHDKIALRLDVLDYHDGSYRLFAAADGHEGSGAFTFRVTPKIELHARFEVGSVIDEGPRNEPLIDNGLVEWNAVGRPVYAPNSANIADALNWGYYGTPNSYSIPFTVTAVSHPGQSGVQIINEAGQLFVNAPYPSPIITNPSDMSPAINELGPHGRRHATWETDSVSADVELAPRVFLQASFNHLQDHTIAWNNPGANYINVDANLDLPNGQPNPDAGKLYISGNGNTYTNRQIFDRGRLLFSAEEDLGKWLGHYHAAVSIEQDDDSMDSPAYFEVWSGAPFGGPPESGNNVVSRRTYVTEGQWNTYYMVSPGDNSDFIQNAVDPATGQKFSSTMAPYAISSDRTRQRDIMGIVQGTYLDDRLAVNAGARRDTLTEFTRGTGRDPATDFLMEDASTGSTISEGGNTTSVGAVLHLYRSKFFDFDVLADKSNNFGLPNAGLYDLTDKVTGQTTQAMPASNGTGKEWGFAVTLLDGMLYLKAVHFADATMNLFNYIGADSVAYKNYLILSALASEGFISQATLDARDTSRANVAPYNETDAGNEITLIANLTKNWRLQVNFSENNPNATGVEAGDIALWKNSLLPFYAQFPQNIPNNADPYAQGDTIAQLIQLTNQQIAYDTSVEGKGLIGFRKYKWNFFTRYTVPATFLKGLFVGGGYIFQSQMLIGAYSDGSNQYGGKTGTASGLIGYNTTIAGHDVRIQLNVLNLFNDTAPVVYRREIVSYPSNYYYPGAQTTGLPISLYFPTPRTWRLTADWSF